MDITLDLELAERIAGHLLDVLSSDQGQHDIPNLRVGLAVRDLDELFAAILEAKQGQ